MNTEYSNPFSPLKGLPHLLFASRETIPNIIGMKELESRQYALLHTKEIGAGRLRSICRAFGFTELTKPILIDAIDTDATENALRPAISRLRDASPSGWVWNFTPGTKQMMVAVMRGLSINKDSAAPVRGSIYINTRGEGTVSLLDPAFVMNLGTRLNVQELLIAQGIFPKTQHQKEPSPFVFALPEDHTLVKPPWPAIASEIIRNLERYACQISAIRRSKSDRAHLGTSYMKLLEDLNLSSHLPSGFPLSDRHEKSLVSFMNGKWLEVYLFSVLDELRKEGYIDDVKWSLGIEKWESADLTYSQNTDIDVFLTVKNNFCHISCKTEQKANIKDELLRIFTWKSLFGGAFGKGIIVHLSDKGIHHQSFAEQLQIGIIRGKECIDRKLLKLRIIELCT